MSDLSQAVALLEGEGVTFRVEADNNIVADAELERLSPECVRALEELRPRTHQLLLLLRERDADLPPQDKYAAAFMAAVRRAVPSGLPPGMMPWLSEAQPHLHDALTRRIPDLIQLLWANGAPSGDFDEALAELTEGYGRAVRFHMACHTE